VTHHEKRVICARTNDPDLYAVLWIPLGVSSVTHTRQMKDGTYTGKAVKDVHVVAGVEVVDSAFAVDLKSIWTGSK
jgi:hypothetical protein